MTYFVCHSPRQRRDRASPCSRYSATTQLSEQELTISWKTKRGVARKGRERCCCIEVVLSAGESKRPKLPCLRDLSLRSCFFYLSLWSATVFFFVDWFEALTVFPSRWGYETLPRSSLILAASTMHHWCSKIGLTEDVWVLLLSFAQQAALRTIYSWPAVYFSAAGFWKTKHVWFFCWTHRSLSKCLS